MKVCLFSNSHAAMLKHTLDERPVDGWTPVLFAAPATKMKGFRPYRPGVLSTKSEELRRFVLRTSAGNDKIVLRDYDAFIVFGLTVKTQTALRIFKYFQPHKHHVLPEAQLISESAFKAAVRENFAKTNGARFLGYVRDQGRPVLFAPSPLPSELILDKPDFGWIREHRDALLWVNKICREIWQTMADEYGAKLVLQPDHTIVGGLTSGEYAKGAVRVTGGSFNEGDADHMNPAFGRIMLDAFGSAL